MNMLALYSFGTSLIQVIGAANFTSLYLNSAMAASIFSIVYPILFRVPLIGPSLGASGALFGIFGTFAALFPTAKIMLLFVPVPGGAVVAFLGSVAWNIAGCVMRWGSFDYAAHLGGSLFGVLYGLYINQLIKSQQARRRATYRW
jgi:rhomboid-like protein